MKRRHGRGALAAALCAFSACAPPPPPAEPSAPETPPPAAEVAPPPCQRIERIEVHKGERRLRAWCEGGAVVDMPVALGRESGPKQASGDWRTPEGEYRISGAARESRFHLFLPIDYPSPADAEAAHAAGRLSRAETVRILDAHARGDPPPPDTGLGGDLGFHGEGPRWRGDSPYLDWTYGCVALSDEDIAFLAAHSEVGTPVVILP